MSKIFSVYLIFLYQYVTEDNTEETAEKYICNPERFIDEVEALL